MCIYQRYLSKSLIFFSVLFIIFLLFIESNIGFKWIFNFTNRFFIGLTVEEISGNWRDFTLKNIRYNIFGIAIRANSVHVILDTKSLFKISTIFKEIETKNLIISLKKNTSLSSSTKNISANLLKKNFFIKYPLVFRKVHADKILFKTPSVNMFCFNLISGIKLINNNIIFFPTYIHTIRLISSNFNLKKKNIENKLSFIKNINSSQEIYSILYFLVPKPKILIPVNINLIHFKCKKISFLDHKKYDLFNIVLKAKLEKNTLNIRKIQINSSFLKIKSYGKFILHNDYSLSCIINNTILMPKLHNRNIKLSLKANLNKKLTFALTSNNLHKINIYGTVLIDSFNHSFYVKLKSKNLFWSMKKHCILKLKRFHGILKGTINDYSISLKNTFSMKGMPSIFMDIHGKGNLQTIFLNKIKVFPVKTIKSYKKKIHLEKNIIYNQYISRLIGKINAVGNYNNNTYNLFLPKIDLKANIMQRKLSILGSLYYKKFNLLEIPGINLLAGNNQLYLRGSLGTKNNIYSAIYANHLEYFVPNLKGKLKSKINFNDDKVLLPVITSKIIVNDLHWNSISLKKIKIFANMNVNNKYAGNFLINMKKINISNVHINSLNVQMHWNDYKQNFYFLLKSHKLHMNLIVNGFIDHKTGNWFGYFKKIDIRTFFGKIKTRKNSVIYYSDSHNIINHFYEKNMNIKNIFSSYLNKTKNFFFNIFNQSSINFTSQLFINAKLPSILGKKISNAKIILIGNNIKLKRKVDKKVFFEKLDYLKLSINLVRNKLKSKWIGKKSIDFLEKQNIYGHLNIIDIYNRKNLKGNCTISNFPISFINFFTTNFKEVKGVFQSNIEFFGTLDQPKVSADFGFQSIFIKSDNILKYITLFFPYFLGKTDNVKINQEIIIKKGNVMFKLDSFLKNSNNIIEWNLLFNSKKIVLVVLPKIKVNFSSKLNLHYLLSKYDLTGYINFYWFYFNIDEKNFIF